MTKIEDLVQPRQEVLDGNLQGVIQAYKVESEGDSIESEPEKFFSTTYPSNAIKNVLARVNDKLTYESDRGGFVLSGPRGSGKSHALVTLYHLFKHPKIAKDWLKNWHIDLKIPQNSDGIILSAQETDPDLLWEPIFRKAGKEDLLNKVKRYPTTDIIKELVGDRTFAIFLDEFGTWWETFDESVDRKNIKKNEMFLLALLEVADDRDYQLNVFITSYGSISGLDQTLNRTKPYREDMASTGDREEIIFHRLLETPRNKLDRGRLKKVIQEYTRKYEEPIHISNMPRYEEKFLKSYPFHPQLLQIVDDIYEGAKERQSVRGEMVVLADTLAKNYDQTDAILLSDIEAGAIREIDRELVNKYETDVKKRVGKDTLAEKILKVILMFSLQEAAAASESDILLGTFKPTEGMSLTQLSMALENIFGKAHYLHKKDGHYSIKKQRALWALIESEKRDIQEDSKEVREELITLIKREIFENQGYIYEFEREEIPDHKKNEFVVTLRTYGSDENLKSELEKFLHGRQYQNALVFITPKHKDILDDSALLEKLRRVRAAKRLKERIEGKEDDLDLFIRDGMEDAISYLEDLYGYWIKWASQQKEEIHEVALIKKKVQPDIQEIRDTIKTDRSVLKEAIMREIKGNEQGKPVGTLLGNFKAMRKYPFLSNETLFYNVIKELNREQIIIRGDRGNEYWATDPIGEIKDSWEIIDIDYASRPEIPEAEEVIQERQIEGEEVPEIGETQKTKFDIKEARGSSPRAISNKYNMSIDESKLKGIIKLKLDIDFDSLTKEELLDLIESLPDCEFIESEIKVEERAD